MRSALSLSMLVSLTLIGCAHTEDRAVEPVAAIPPLSDKPVLMGSVVGHDGKPLPLAHVHVGKKAYPVNADGSFRIEPERTGFTPLKFSGVNHAETSAAVWLEDRATRVDVQLGTHPREEPPSQVGLIIEKDGKLPMKAAQPMQRRGDGTWALTVEAPKGRFAYQLLHVASSGHTMNGTQAQSYEYDGGGDYISVIEAPGGALEIVFDPRALPKAAAAPAAVLANPRDAKLTRWVERFEARNAAAEKAAMTAMKNGADSKGAFAAMLSALHAGGYAEEYANALQNETDPAVKQLLTVGLLALWAKQPGKDSPEATALADTALAEIDARSDVWAVDIDALLTALKRATDREKAAAYEAAIVDSHPTENVSAALLFGQLKAATDAGEVEKATELFNALTGRFPKSHYAFFARRIDPTVQVKVGAKIPAFAFPVSGDPTKKLTPETFKGKTYLISLWASWCKPCIEKMDTLHALQKQYGDKAFTIVAVAILDQEAAVKTFREDNAKKWPMPWEHAYVPEESADATMKQLAAVGLPSSLLVGPDGTILATNKEIDREGLEKLVAAAVASKSASK